MHARVGAGGRVFVEDQRDGRAFVGDGECAGNEVQLAVGEPHAVVHAVGLHPGGQVRRRVDEKELAVVVFHLDGHVREVRRNVVQQGDDEPLVIEVRAVVHGA